MCSLVLGLSCWALVLGPSCLGPGAGWTCRSEGWRGVGVGPSEGGGHADGQHGGDGGEDGGHQPDPSGTAAAEEHLAEERPDRQAAVDGDGEERRRLAPAVVGGEVLGGGGDSDAGGSGNDGPPDVTLDEIDQIPDQYMPRTPAVDEVITIAPPSSCSIMRRSPARTALNTPVRLVSIVSAQASEVSHCTGPGE